MIKDLRCLAILASSDSTVEEHSPHHPKVEGLSPAVKCFFGKMLIGQKSLAPKTLMVNVET